MTNYALHFQKSKPGAGLRRSGAADDDRLW